MRFHNAATIRSRLQRALIPYRSAAVTCLFISSLALMVQAEEKTFELGHATIQDINTAMDSGALTAEKLVGMYLKRIETYDRKGPSIEAVLAINPNLMEIAKALDEERKTSGPRSPLHGIPVVVKDVFDTKDMPTTGGFKAMAGAQPPRDCFIVEKLRAAGAIIFAKVNQSDWYGATDTIATSSLGGATKNPHALDRTPGWSSSGTGASLAAWFAPLGLGSETGFSIRTPSSDSNVYGIATTSGLISRAGQMWSYVTGERGGPMARSVYDVAVALDVIAGFDIEDMWTARSLGKMPMEPYVSFIDPNGLKGARLGVLKEAYDFYPVTEEAVEMFEKVYAALEAAGAKVVKDVSLGVNLPDVIRNGSPSRFERLTAINHYLARQGDAAPFKNVKEMIENDIHPVKDTITNAYEDQRDLNKDPEYRAILKGKEALRNAIVELMDKHGLDALIYPHKLYGPLKLGPTGDPERTYIPNQTSPVTGLPAFIVPGGFTESGLPIGLEILGREWDEPTLIKIASGIEAEYNQLKLPETTPALEGESFAY